MQERVLIHTPTGRDAGLAASVLSAAGIVCKICPSIEELVIHLESGAGVVLTVEEVISYALQPLADFVSRQPAWSDIPIVVMTRHGADAPALAPLLDRLGNVTLLERPVRTLALITALRSALRARQKQFLAREASRRKDEFLASLGHELRNPLAPIRNSMGILKHLYPDVPVVTKVRGIVERQITHLTRLVDDLLDVARITNGKVVLKPETFSLDALVDHVMELGRAMAQEKMLTLTTQLPQETVLLHADYARLIQVLANIFLNAIKFTPEHGEIVLFATVVEETITFTIKDSGIGIACESFDAIFDLFSQEKPLAGPVTSGLGIGLNLSKKFTEMHGGSIHVQSKGEGKGSKFSVILPVVARNTDGVASFQEVDQPASNSNKQPVLLVVDDNRDAANMLQALFEIEDFEVITAYNGFDAIAAVTVQIPDVIIMDLGMPGIDGYDTVRIIRAQPGAQHILIVALTGWGQTEARLKAINAGFDHHIIKPVDFDALKRLINTATMSDQRADY